MCQKNKMIKLLTRSLNKEQIITMLKKQQFTLLIFSMSVLYFIAGITSSRTDRILFAIAYFGLACYSFKKDARR